MFEVAKDVYPSTHQSDSVAKPHWKNAVGYILTV